MIAAPPPPRRCRCWCYMAPRTTSYTSAAPAAWWSWRGLLLWSRCGPLGTTTRMLRPTRSTSRACAASWTSCSHQLAVSQALGQVLYRAHQAARRVRCQAGGQMLQQPCDHSHQVLVREGRRNGEGGMGADGVCPSGPAFCGVGHSKACIRGWPSAGIALGMQQVGHGSTMHRVAHSQASIRGD
jgi:hypothetical protein